MHSSSELKFSLKKKVFNWNKSPPAVCKEKWSHKRIPLRRLRWITVATLLVGLALYREPPDVARLWTNDISFKWMRQFPLAAAPSPTGLGAPFRSPSEKIRMTSILDVVNSEHCDSVHCSCRSEPSSIALTLQPYRLNIRRFKPCLHVQHDLLLQTL